MAKKELIVLPKPKKKRQKRGRRKNIIDKEECTRIIEAYGFKVREINYYQFRICGEETTNIYDWYHTTGSTVVTKQGTYRPIIKGIGKYKDVEDMLNAIKRYD